MAVSVSISNYEWSTSEGVHLEAMPDTCPVCHHGVDPRKIAGAKVSASGDDIQYAFQCTRARCRSIFVGYYSKISGRYRLKRTAPVTYVEQKFAPEVEGVSPTFVAVFNQSVAAETAGLDQLTGIGLRKALEFLIKDFACDEHQASCEEIKTKPLARCIADYIADPNLQVTAKRAAWLGNDETHYVRRWEDKDIRDLKLLITLTVNWVQNVLLTRKYQDEMPE